MFLISMPAAAAQDPGAKGRPNYLRDSLLGILPLLLGIQFFASLTFISAALRGHADFRQLYAAGYLVRTGQGYRLYDYRAQKSVQDALASGDERALPFIRPAYQALIFVPFSLVRFRTAYLIFLALNVLLLAVCYWLLRAHLTRLKEAWWGLPTALFLAFYPIALALLQGQDSVLLLTLLCAALLSLDAEHEFAAGLLVGLGLFKFQIVIPIAVLFFAWRRWAFSLGFVISSASVSLLSVAVVGWGQTITFARALFSVGAGVETAQFPTFPLRVSLMANLRGLVTAVVDGRVPAIWLQSATLLLSVLVITWLVTRVPRTLPTPELFSVAITASVVTSYYLFIHDLSVLLIPILLTLDRFMESCGRPGRLTGWLAALMFVAPMCLFLMPAHFYLLALLVCAFVAFQVRTLASGVIGSGVPAALGMP